MTDEPRPPSWKPRLRWMGAVLASLSAGLSALSACTRPASHYVIDAAMSSAHRPAVMGDAMFGGAGASPPANEGRPRYELLAGDLHCHVMPPDHPPHVTRGVAQTIELAASEGLDFVVLTPHIGARFFQEDAERRFVIEALAELRRAVDAGGPTRTLFLTGMEYTDHTFGHVGVAFVDMKEVLAAVPTAEARRRPERFFEEVVARGGVLVVNHPLVTPLDSIVSIARADLSWRPFTSEWPFPPEIAAVNRLAQGFEAYNLTATHLRDRYLLGDTEHTIRATLRRLDSEIVGQQRRMSPVGGTDSHSGHLRATTFVLSEGRTERAIRDAIVGGRMCVRDPGACSLEVRAQGGPWLPVGAALKDVATIEARVRGEDIEILVDGEIRERLPQTGAVRIPLDASRCSVIRARVGEGYSAPIYLNCPFT